MSVLLTRSANKPQQIALLPLLFVLIRFPVQSFPNFQSQKALHIVYSPSQCLEQGTVAFATQSSVTANVVDRQSAVQTRSPLGV